MVRVVAVEGVHGIGKTTFINKLRDSGRVIVDEEFMNTTMADFKPNGMARQVTWIGDWIQRVVKAARSLDEGQTVYVDRSIYSAIMYNESVLETQALRHVIDKSLDELRKQNIDVYTVLFLDNDGGAWQRVQDRLQKEPERRQFKADAKGHFDRVWDKYYRKYRSLFDAHMDAPNGLDTEIDEFDRLSLDETI